MDLVKGKKLPDGELINDKGETVRIGDYRGKRLILFFYPKANTPGCTAEARDFSDLQSEFAQYNTALLGVSADSSKKLDNFRTKHALSVDLASDEGTEYLQKLQIWTEKKLYGKTFMGIVRTTILLDEAGNILNIWPKVRVKEHARQVLDHVRSL